MDFDLRIKALSRLAQSGTEAAENALRKELGKIRASLDVEKQYEQLERDIELLDTFSHRFSDLAVRIFLDFILTIESRPIIFSQRDLPLESDVRKYFNSSTLIVRAVESLIHLRYLETKSVLHALLQLSEHDRDNVRSAVRSGLETLAAYDRAVFFGTDMQPAIGAAPQKQIIDELGELGNDDLKKWFSSVLVILNGLLSPTIHGTSWSYAGVTLSQTPTPPLSTISDIRLLSIELLKRMYAPSR